MFICDRLSDSSDQSLDSSLCLNCFSTLILSSYWENIQWILFTYIFSLFEIVLIRPEIRSWFKLDKKSLFQVAKRFPLYVCVETILLTLLRFSMRSLKLCKIVLYRWNLNSRGLPVVFAGACRKTGRPQRQFKVAFQCVERLSWLKQFSSNDRHNTLWTPKRLKLADALLKF